MGEKDNTETKDEPKTSDELKNEQPSARAKPEIIELGEAEKKIIKKIIIVEENK